MQGQEPSVNGLCFRLGHKPGQLEDRDYKGNLVQNLGNSEVPLAATGA